MAPEGSLALSNADIAELLAVAAKSAKQPLQKALRRASRKSFLWPDEATTLVQEGRSLEELPGVGPSLSRIIKRWLDNPPDVPHPPDWRVFDKAAELDKAIEIDCYPDRQDISPDLLKLAATAS